ncbi:hypothetical protein NIES4106_47450 [Fischerella sp. NIES-4106]|nr:hypothetical protein NIES4106_47450 [Fischerella sp. NIES-4106]
MLVFLALPAFTLSSGIIPSTILLIGVWLYAPGCQSTLERVFKL